MKITINDKQCEKKKWRVKDFRTGELFERWQNNCEWVLCMKLNECRYAHLLDGYVFNDKLDRTSDKNRPFNGSARIKNEVKDE